MWLGAAGNGSRLKLVANSWVLTVVEGIAESLTLARALGLDPQQFLDVVKGGAMDAPYVQLKGSAMLAGDFATAFGLDGAAKDAELIVQAARDAGADLAVIEAVRTTSSGPGRRVTATRTWRRPSSRTEPRRDRRRTRGGVNVRDAAPTRRGACCGPATTG